MTRANATLLREVKKDLRNRRYDFDPVSGLYTFKGGLVTAQGYVTHDVNGLDRRTDPNIVTTEGLNYLLDAGIDGAAQITVWHAAPYTNNVSPAATWTGQNFHANAAESTAYDETTRVPYTTTAASGGVITNASAKAAFTANAVAAWWGIGILQHSAKQNATAGQKCLAAAKFAAVRNLVDDDVLNVGYTLTLTSPP